MYIWGCDINEGPPRPECAKYFRFKGMDGCMHGCIYGRMDKWIDEAMNGWMDGLMEQ